MKYNEWRKHYVGSKDKDALKMLDDWERERNSFLELVDNIKREIGAFVEQSRNM